MMKKGLFYQTNVIRDYELAEHPAVYAERRTRGRMVNMEKNGIRSIGKFNEVRE